MKDGDLCSSDFLTHTLLTSSMSGPKEVYCLTGNATPFTFTSRRIPILHRQGLGLFAIRQIMGQL
jgi:hypothetical protein